MCTLQYNCRFSVTQLKKIDLGARTCPCILIVKYQKYFLKKGITATLVLLFKKDWTNFLHKHYQHVGSSSRDLLYWSASHILTSSSRQVLDLIEFRICGFCSKSKQNKPCNQLLMKQNSRLQPKEIFDKEAKRITCNII